MEEIELTYLAKELPAGIAQAPCKELIDIYIPVQAPHPRLRIRKLGDKHEITKKEPVHGNDSSHFLETTVPLTAEEFNELDQLPGKRVHKTRYYYKENDILYEVDVFHDELAGLVLVDVEFDSLSAKSSFTPPAWCLADVTQENFVAGGLVCGKTYADLENDLNKFGYKKLELSV